MAHDNAADSGWTPTKRGRYVTRPHIARRVAEATVATAVLTSSIIAVPVVARAQTVRPARPVVTVRAPRHSSTRDGSPAVPPVSSATMQEWRRVAVCEEGGNWYAHGGTYSGGLGITNENWRIYGGTAFAPSANGATPEEQVLVAQRIQHFPPDQNGCRGSW